ncbi:MULTISPECIES: hypothetical protein [Fusobacterium]|uniref:hypothetical protein n=1 Tax=Fusobacterium TaxID=848 RepID=UPI0015A5ECDC|nr:MULTISPECIES: hypothetical protein [Fusobacterium]MCF2612058.1 hypothetical protein [Fusobacterium perfoetens]MDY2980341.1 hypothetical protein [Fusobacterium sp.]
MLDFLKKLFGTDKKEEQVTTVEKPTVKKEKLTAEKLEAEPEMQVAAMMATVEAAGEKDLSNFRIRSIKKL